MKSVFASAVITALIIFKWNNGIVGKWESQPSPKGNITRVVFKADNTFDGFVNKKPFVTGTYTFKDTILSFVDNGCDGKKGVYRVVFFSNADSIRFVPLSDSCGERKDGMSRTVLGRIK